VTDRYIADLSVDKSADRSVWIRMGKLRVDRLQPIWKTTRIGLDRLIARILRVCASPIHRLCAVDVGQNKGIVSAVADIRKIITGLASQPMVEAYQKKGIG
jgi:hypothetical protein